MACDDNFYMPSWAMWTLFGMTMGMILILAVSLVESITKKSAKLVQIITVFLMLGDLITLIWVWVNSKLHSKGDCRSQNYEIVIVAILACLMLALNQLSYWLLASSYY